MGTVNKQYTFSDETNANPLEVNANFDDIINEINGLLDEENLNLDKSTFRTALLAAIKAVDGTGSGLDADLYRGVDISDHEGRITANEGDISTHEGRITTNEGSISNIEDGTTKVPSASQADNATKINNHKITVSSVAPSSPNENDIWIEV